MPPQWLMTGGDKRVLMVRKLIEVSKAAEVICVEVSFITGVIGQAHWAASCC